MQTEMPRVTDLQPGTDLLASAEMLATARAIAGTAHRLVADDRGLLSYQGKIIIYTTRYMKCLQGKRLGRAKIPAFRLSQPDRRRHT